MEKAGQVPPLHPVRSGAALDSNGAAFTGAIDKAAMAASRSNEAFIAISSQEHLTPFNRSEFGHYKILLRTLGSNTDSNPCAEADRTVAVGTRISPRPPGRRRRSPAPAPSERGVRIYRTTLFGSWFTAFTAICSSFVSMVS